MSSAKTTGHDIVFSLERLARPEWTAGGRGMSFPTFPVSSDTTNPLLSPDIHPLLPYEPLAFYELTLFSGSDLPPSVKSLNAYNGCSTRSQKIRHIYYLLSISSEKTLVAWPVAVHNRSLASIRMMKMFIFLPNTKSRQLLFEIKYRTIDS